jgi:hypothetical protein
MVDAIVLSDRIRALPLPPDHLERLQQRLAQLAGTDHT